MALKNKVENKSLKKEEKKEVNHYAMNGDIVIRFRNKIKPSHSQPLTKSVAKKQIAKDPDNTHYYKSVSYNSDKDEYRVSDKDKMNHTDFYKALED